MTTDRIIFLVVPVEPAKEDDLFKLYEQYYRLSVTGPFDAVECEAAYIQWVAATRRMFKLVTNSE